MAKSAKLEAILFVPDCHHPYHDRAAWSLLLAVGRDLHPTHLAILGDFADMFSVSSHSKDPRRIQQLEVELAGVRRGLDDLDALKAKHKIYVAGNHEDRLTRYLQDKAPELFASVSIPAILGLKARGWEYIPYRHDVRLGKLYLTHDVGAGSAGRMAAAKALDVYTHSVAIGHGHRMQMLVEGSAVGDTYLGIQFGWLGDAEQADYMHRVKAKKDWALGFGVGYLNPATGLVYVTPIPIIKGTCVVNGIQYGR